MALTHKEQEELALLREWLKVFTDFEQRFDKADFSFPYTASTIREDIARLKRKRGIPPVEGRQ